MKAFLIFLSSLGDVERATPAAESLREILPAAEGHVRTKPALGDVFEGTPRVTPPAPPRTSGLGVFKIAWSSAEPCDRAVDLHVNLRTRPAVLVTDDSSPLRLAAAQGTPAAADFGFTTRSGGIGLFQAASHVVQLDPTCCPCRPLDGNRCPEGNIECVTALFCQPVSSAAP